MSCSCSWIALASAFALAAARPDAEHHIQTLRQIDREGAGNAAARDAWRALSEGDDAAAVPLILAAMDGANPLAANWLRSAADAICERLSGGDAFPRDALETFLADTSHAPRARVLAFEWILRVDPAARERWLPRFRDDPSVDLRREAVASLLARAAAADAGTDAAAETGASASAARDLYREALAAARDQDQFETALKRLRELGDEIDIPRHFGFIRSWHVIGPFDNAQTRGLAAVYPPEKELDLTKAYPGKDGEVAWESVDSDDEYGAVDLNRAVVHAKGVLAYAYHEFPSDEARDAEVRIATVNAWKLWVNGELLNERDEYHHGTRIDHYRVPVKLNRGKNRILFKVCQNEQTEDYADPWRFQLRLSDATGTAILPAKGEES